MAQRRQHYERAFEQYLRAKGIPSISVDEARRALLPSTAPSHTHGVSHVLVTDATGSAPATLKSFDFVLYGRTNLLAEVKGRRLARPRGAAASPSRPTRLESWTTLEDVRSLLLWEQLFGPEFRACFIFVYWCEEQPPDALFHETFEHAGRWYSVRCVPARDYAAAMRTRSPRWGTVHLQPRVFDQLWQPLAV